MAIITKALIATTLAASLQPSCDSRRAPPPRECVRPQSPALPSTPALEPGRYDLTLVATAGPKRGATVMGTIDLLRTSAADRSQVTGRQLTHVDTLAMPLYGWADVDFARVGAPVDLTPIDTLVPKSSSRDPARPGVVVLDFHWTNVGHRPMVAIGSLSGRRDDAGWADGPGIGLSVWYNRGADFTGVWDRFGVVRGGSGYFCAWRLGP